jgi:hypothetical protein
MRGMRIDQLVSAESGWKAVFKEPDDGGESMSRIVGWAIVGGDDNEIVGVVVDPEEPSKLVAAPDAISPGGGNFVRYRYVPPEPVVVQAPAPAAPAEEKKPESTTEQLAKNLLKRKR